MNSGRAIEIFARVISAHAALPQGRLFIALQVSFFSPMCVCVFVYVSVYMFLYTVT